MKICDRHYNLDGSSAPATEQVTFSNTGEKFDLCHSCAEGVRDAITTPAAEDKLSDDGNPKKRKRRQPARTAEGEK